MHPDLVEVVKLAIQRTAVNFTVVGRVRTLARQREYVTKGASQTMSSYHLPQADGLNSSETFDIRPIFMPALHPRASVHPSI